MIRQNHKVFKLQGHLSKCDDKRELDKASGKLKEIKNLEDMEFKHQNENTEPVLIHKLH